MKIRLEDILAVYDGLASLIWELMGGGSHWLPVTYDYSINLMYINTFQLYISHYMSGLENQSDRYGD
jgi:hypothetical protein